MAKIFSNKSTVRLGDAGETLMEGLRAAGQRIWSWVPFTGGGRGADPAAVDLAEQVKGFPDARNRKRAYKHMKASADDILDAAGKGKRTGFFTRAVDFLVKIATDGMEMIGKGLKNPVVVVALLIGLVVGIGHMIDRALQRREKREEIEAKQQRLENLSKLEYALNLEKAELEQAQIEANTNEAFYKKQGQWTQGKQKAGSAEEYLELQADGSYGARTQS